MRVEEVYRPGALTCDAADPVPDVARTMVDAHVGALAVVDGDVLVGMISERDVVRAVAEHTDLTRAAAGSFASRLLVALTPGPGLARLGPDARSVALIAAAHAAPVGARVALTWHARAGHR
jgi:CBS domain-containing protein